MSETMVCCPLDGIDDNGPKCFSSRAVNVRKPHECSECGELVPAGARSEHAKGMWDGEWSSFRTCLSCVEIRDHFACGNGWIYGEVWAQLEENFFPDMKAGGKCMEGLSPAAKARLFEARTEWLFESEREQDGAPRPTDG